MTNMTDSMDAGNLFDLCVETAKVLILGTSNGHSVLPNLSEAMQARILSVARANYEYLTGTEKAEPNYDSDTLDKVRRAIKSTYACNYDGVCKYCSENVEDIISAMQEAGIRFSVRPVMRESELTNVIYDEVVGPAWKALTIVNEPPSGPEATAAEWAAANPSSSNELLETLTANPTTCYIGEPHSAAFCVHNRMRSSYDDPRGYVSGEVSSSAEAKDDLPVRAKVRRVLIERMVSNFPALTGATIDRIFEILAEDPELNIDLKE